MAVICAACGQPIPEDFMFCGNCSVRIENATDQELQIDTDPVQHSSSDPKQYFSSDNGQFSSSEYEPAFPTTPITVDYEHIADCMIAPVQPITPPPPSPAAATVRAFLSVILGILLLAFIITIVALLATRPAKIPEIIANADVTWVLDETDIGEVVVDGLNQSDFIEKTLGEHDSEDSGTDIESRTRALGKRIEAIPGIISAAVVINGPTAIIGIRVQGSPESDILIEMKKKVKDLALTFDPDLTQAAVTATPELYERITGVAGKRTRISPDKRRLFPVVESL